MAKPFLKWAGGKRQLISEIEKRLPSHIDEIETYIEPFIGGGALLFHMLENYNFNQIHLDLYHFRRTRNSTLLLFQRK